MRVRLRQRATSSRAIRTCAVCSRRVRRRPTRSSQTARSSAPSGTAQFRVEVVQVPAQPLLSPPSLVDQVVAVIDQQLQLAQPLLTRRADGRAAARAAPPCDGERVDRVGLAARAAGTPLRRHQLRRYPHQPLARRRAASARAHAVSCRQSSSAHSRSDASDADQTSNSDAEPAVSSASAAPGLVDGDRRQRLLVHVHSDHDHSDRLLQRRGRPASGQTSIEAAATLLSGHARRSREGGGDTTLASQPTGDAHAGITRVSRRRPESVSRSHRTPPQTRA